MDKPYESTASGLASLGRGTDTALVHMSPGEVDALQQIAEQHGGSLTVNPHTGLPEAGFLSSILPAIAGAGLSALTGGALNPLTIGLLTGGATGLITGDLGKGLSAGLGSFGGAGLAQGLGLSAAGEAAKQAATAPLPGGLTTAAGAPGLAARAATPTVSPTFFETSKAVLADPSTFGAGKQLLQGTKGLLTYGAGALAPAALEPPEPIELADTGPTMEERYPYEGPYGFPEYAVTFPNAPDEFAREYSYFGPEYGARPLYFADGGEVDTKEKMYFSEDYFKTPTANAAFADSPIYAGIAKLNPALAAKLNPALAAKYGINLPEQPKAAISRPRTPVTYEYSDTGEVMYFPESYFRTEPTRVINPVAASRATATPLRPFTGGGLGAYQGYLAARAATGNAAASRATTTPFRPFTGGGGLGAYQAPNTRFAAAGGYLSGDGDGMSDEIVATIDSDQPARLSDGEFVVPADVVSHIGNGSSNAGAKKLYAMMDRVRMARGGTTTQPPKKNMDKLLPA